MLQHFDKLVDSRGRGECEGQDYDRDGVGYFSSLTFGKIERVMRRRDMQGEEDSDDSGLGMGVL